MSATNKTDETFNALFVEKLSVATYQFPTSDGTVNQVLRTDGLGNVSWGSANSSNILCLLGKITTNQNSNLGVGNHIKLDTLLFDSSPNISLDTSTAYTTTTGAASIGRITLTGGKSYLLEFSSVQYTATSFVVSWYNASNNTFIDGPTSGSFPGCIAFFSPISTTLVEVRIVGSLVLSSISNGFVKVTQLN